MGAQENLLAEAESLLEAAESRPYAADEAVANVALAVAVINDEMRQDGRDKERLRKVIEKLQKVGREVAIAAGARAFSISVGFPSGISVSFEWEGRS